MSNGAYDTCSRQMPRVSHRYFAHLEPEALALITEASSLQHRLRHMVSIECGILWAAIRCLERGDAKSDAFGSVDSATIEEEYKRWFRPFSDVVTDEDIEHYQTYNALYTLPYRTPPGEQVLQWEEPVSAAKLLSAIIERCNFEMVVTAPFGGRQRDPQAIHAELSHPGSFVATESLRQRGIWPTRLKPLIERAAQKASYIGSWLITEVIAVSAMADWDETQGHLPQDADQRWTWEVEAATEHIELPGCVMLLSFPGPRPWTSRAASVFERLVTGEYGEQ
jgi:hypothetical protein